MIKKTLKRNTINLDYRKEFKTPEKIKKLMCSHIRLNILNSIIVQIGAFTLSLATITFSKNLVLSLVFLVLYLIREPIFAIIRTKFSQYDTLFEESTKEFLASIKGKVLSKTADKIIIERGGRIQKMSAPVISDTISEYITRRYKVLLGFLMFTLDSIIFAISLIFLLNIAIKQTNNLPLLVSVILIAFILMIISAIFLSKSRENLWKKAKPKFDKRKNAERDVQEIEPISLKHTKFLLSNEVKAQKEITKLTLKDMLRKNIADIIRAAVISVSLVVVVFVMMFTSSSNKITETIFMTSIAFGQAFSSVISSIGSRITQVYDVLNERKENKIKYESDFNKIMEVYFKESKVIEKSFQGNTLVIAPFKFTYPITGFNLVQNKSLTLQRGQVILLDGKSGTGKSTYVKIISGENNLPGMEWKLKSIKYFNDTSRFGNNNLLDEITLGDYTEDDYERLSEILLGTKLSSKFDTVESLKFVSAKELSNGLTQRALLARTLYNLEDTDLVCIDEPIGSLDEENAKEVTSFIREYCNRDKKRFVIICTHQHKFINDQIDGKIFIKHISALQSEVMV